MISRRAAIGAVTAFLLALAWNGRLSAQFTTASLNGVIVDPSGAAVPGAKVSVRNTGTGFESAVTSGETGLYVFPRLPVGSYSLQVEKEGFSTYVQEGVVLTVKGEGHVTSILYETRGATPVYTLETKGRKVETRSEGLAEITSPIGKKLRKDGLSR